MNERSLDIRAGVVTALEEHGHLATPVDTLDDHSDLYEAGLTSHASVNLMLAVEDAFEIEFPEELLQRRTFGTIGALVDAVTNLTKGAGDFG